MTIGLILNDRRRYDCVTKRGVVIWIVEEKKSKVEVHQVKKDYNQVPEFA